LSVIEAEGGDLSGVELRAALVGRHAELLTADAVAFLAALHRRFDSQRQRLLKLREGRQKRLDSGVLPAFADETVHIRDGSWTVNPVPATLRDAASMVVGPVARRALIEGLNGGQDVYVADLAHATLPVWGTILDAHLNLHDRWRDALDVTDVHTGRGLRLDDSPSFLMVQPRAWHLDAVNLRVDGQPISASLFDFGLYAFHAASAAVAAGTVCCLSLPMIESHQEARLWDDVLSFGQEFLGLQPGAIRALAVIETLTAAFDMDEILYEMRDSAIGLTVHHTGLCCAYPRQLAEHPDRVLPDADRLAADSGFSGTCAALVADVCRRRGAVALGLDLVDSPKQDGAARAEALLAPPEGPVTEAGLRSLIRMGLGYCEAALRGEGQVTIDEQICTLAHAEFARALLWHQRRHDILLDDGRATNGALISVLIDDEIFALKKTLGPDAFAKRRYADAEKLLRNLVLADRCAGFLAEEMALLNA
jgi:malate synthase